MGSFFSFPKPYIMQIEIATKKKKKKKLGGNSKSMAATCFVFSPLT